MECVYSSTSIPNTRTIMLLHPCYLDLITHNFYILKLRCSWVYVVFSKFYSKYRLGVHDEAASLPPQWDGPNMNTQSMFWIQKKKNIKTFQLKIVIDLQL